MAKYNWNKGFYYYLYHNKLQMMRRNYTLRSATSGMYVKNESKCFGNGFGNGLCWYYFDLSDLDNPDTLEHGFLYLTERNDEKAQQLFLDYAKKKLAAQEQRREWLNVINT